MKKILTGAFIRVPLSVVTYGLGFRSAVLSVLYVFLSLSLLAFFEGIILPSTSLDVTDSS